jgi:hypothetical protein
LWTAVPEPSLALEERVVGQYHDIATVANEVHHANARSPIDNSDDSSVTEVRLEQLVKAYSPIDWQPFPLVTVARAPHLENAETPIEMQRLPRSYNHPPIRTFLSAPHWENARSPIEVHPPSPIVTFASIVSHGAAVSERPLLNLAAARKRERLQSAPEEA